VCQHIFHYCFLSHNMFRKLYSMTDNVPHQEFPVLSCPFVQILYAHDLLNVGSGQQLSCISDTDSAYGVFLYRILWMQTSPQVQMECTGRQHMFAPQWAPPSDSMLAHFHEYKFT
jgi:hypothetical protein